VKQKGRPLLGCEPLEQREEGHGEIVGEVDVVIGRGRRHDRFG
jgi:hypothetical protein